MSQKFYIMTSGPLLALSKKFCFADRLETGCGNNEFFAISF